MKYMLVSGRLHIANIKSVTTLWYCKIYTKLTEYHQWVAPKTADGMTAVDWTGKYHNDWMTVATITRKLPGDVCLPVIAS